MLVHELIKELEQLDPFLEVLVDVTPRFGSHFVFNEFNTVGEFETPDGDKYVVLANGSDSPELPPVN